MREVGAMVEKRGPRTEAGKAAVRLNAVQHGMRSMSPVVLGMEREEDWREHLEGIRASLAPADHFEECLAERIAQLLWRLGRVTAFETASIDRELGDAEHDWEKNEEAREVLEKLPHYASLADDRPKEAWMERRRSNLIIPQGPTLERVTRYEAHLHRQLLQTMHELEALQARKKGQAMPLARLDVAGGPGVS
jgi:hypothetical protein